MKVLFVLCVGVGGPAGISMSFSVLLLKFSFMCHALLISWGHFWEASYGDSPVHFLQHGQTQVKGWTVFAEDILQRIWYWVPNLAKSNPFFLYSYSFIGEGDAFHIHGLSILQEDSCDIWVINIISSGSWKSKCKFAFSQCGVSSWGFLYSLGTSVSWVRPVRRSWLIF